MSPSIRPSRPARIAGRALAALSLLAVSTAGGCSSCAGGGGGRDNLALAPQETQIVVGANLARARDTAVWRKLLDLRDQAIADAKKGSEERAKFEALLRRDGGAAAGPSADVPRSYPEFVEKCGFDPFTQLDSGFLVLPSPPVEGEFGLILRGTFNEAKLIACGKAASKQEGSELVESDYAGHKVYSDSASGTMLVSFLDGKTLVLGGKAWTRKILDQAADPKLPSAKDNAALVSLVGRARTGDALWAAGIIADEIRTKLKLNDRLASAGTMKDLYGSLDFQNGLSVQLVFDLGTDADAADLAKRLSEQLAETRKSPVVMVAGLSSFFDTITVAAKAATLRVDVKLSPAQVDDLLGRAMGWLQRFRGPRPGAPGQMPQAPPMPMAPGMPPMPGLPPTPGLLPH